MTASSEIKTPVNTPSTIATPPSRDVGRTWNFWTPVSRSMPKEALTETRLRSNAASADTKNPQRATAPAGRRSSIISELDERVFDAPAVVSKVLRA